ncbi:MAG: YdeI/OmpD-associated family protein [Acidobacteriota bacterium]
MPKTDPRIDAYIEQAADFAKPILLHIRGLVHQACPEITETMKWSFPHFDYKGIVCSMAAFKRHCAFGFRKQSLLESDAFPKEKTAMGSFGRITSLKDLPADSEMISLIKKAVALNEAGIKAEKKKPQPPKELKVPEALAAALAKNKKARAVFDKLSYSHRKEYIEWIEGAKTEPTRLKRIATTLEWITEGKSLNWKYERPKK